MKTVKILLSTIRDVQNFVGIATAYDGISTSHRVVMSLMQNPLSGFSVLICSRPSQ